MESPLPPLYARWMDEALGGRVPPETRATCHDCAMCGEHAERVGLPPDMRFEPSVRCCTYLPNLPNFLAGAILGDDAPENAHGRDAVRDSIRAHRAATPLGLVVTPEFERQYKQVRTDGRFGRDPSLRCPYLTRDGLCGVWRHRNSVCATWFCRHDDRAQGQRFWQALLLLLQEAEIALARACALEFADASALDELFAPDGAIRRVSQSELRGAVSRDGVLAPELARRVWGRWYGREEEFYETCRDRVEVMDWAAVRALGGPQIALLERRVRDAMEARKARSLPVVLCERSVHALPHDGRVALFGADTPYDPLAVDETVAAALPAFDGRDTRAVLEELRATRGVTVSEQDLYALWRHGALGPDDGKDVPPARQRTGAIEPDETLRFFRNYADCDVTSSTRVNEAGQTEVTVLCGVKEVTFDDPRLLTFARELVAHQNGFRAGDASRWSVEGEALTWEDARMLLASLVEARVLQREATT